MIHAYQKPLSGKSVGIVFGSFAPLHQGHLDLIMRAKKENDGGCLVIVCGYDGDKGEPLMPHKKRYRYVRDIQNMLMEAHGINWNDFETHKKRGSCCIRKTEEVNGVERSKWVIDKEIPIFKGEGREYVEKLIWVGE